MAIFVRACLVDLNVYACLINLRVASNAINARRLPLALLVYSLVRALPIPAMPVLPVGQVLPLDVLNTYTAWVKASKEITGLMLMTMDPDIQKNLEQLDAYDILKELKSFYNMHIMGKTVTELHAMLKLHEQTLPPKDAAPTLHAIRAGMGLRRSRKLKPGVLSLYVGDGHRAAVEAIGEFHLCLPSGLVLILHNCHYAPSITRGIISVSRLYKDGFVNCFENNNTILVSRNKLVYFSAIPWDDIYEIDLSSSNTNDSSMYVVSNKRVKFNLDSTLLCHCRLGHISKKRIEKLQHDGLFNSTGIKSFEKCVFCMSENMARKPYSHQAKKAKDLLELIHTNVCGLFRTMSRQGVVGICPYHK
nr:hypothetical protein [Tanacetum cinerariifolium]